MPIPLNSNGSRRSSNPDCTHSKQLTCRDHTTHRSICQATKQVSLASNLTQICECDRLTSSPSLNQPTNPTLVSDFCKEG